MADKLKLLLNLILTFLKIGAFTFGGGYVMVDVIRKDVVEKRKWLTNEEVLDIIAIAQSTPGAIAINATIYIGAKMLGFVGALFSAIAIVLPSVIIITLIALFFQQFYDNRFVQYAFLGVRAVVSALMLNAVIKLSKPIEKKPVSIIIVIISATLAILAVFNVLNFHIAFILLGAGAFGIIFGIIQRKKASSSKEEAKENESEKEDGELNKETQVVSLAEGHPHINEDCQLITDNSKNEEDKN